jgi:hypothetical protein
MQTWPLLRNKNIHNNSYITATIPTYITTLNTPSKPSNMTNADNNSNTPLLSTPVTPGGNNSQRPKEKLPALSAGPNQPPAANTTGKHRHFATTATITRYAFP